jgi:hypothetical protein
VRTTTVPTGVLTAGHCTGCLADGRQQIARNEIIEGPATYTYDPGVNSAVALIQFDWQIITLDPALGSVVVDIAGDAIKIAKCGVGGSDGPAPCGLVPKYQIEVPAGATVWVHTLEAI